MNKILIFYAFHRVAKFQFKYLKRVTTCFNRIMKNKLYFFQRRSQNQKNVLLHLLTTTTTTKITKFKHLLKFLNSLLSKKLKIFQSNRNRLLLKIELHFKSSSSNKKLKIFQSNRNCLSLKIEFYFKNFRLNVHFSTI